MTTRNLSVIARDIKAHWPKMYFGAVPYWEAMSTMDKITDDYGADSGKSVVLDASRPSLTPC
jgi:hypothetical protein